MADDPLTAALERLSAIEQAATPGPWEILDEDEIWSQAKPGHVAETMCNPADAAFIAEARTAMPLLVAAVRAALEKADEWAAGSFRHDVSTTVTASCARQLREALSSALQPDSSKDGGDGTVGRTADR